MTETDFRKIEADVSNRTQGIFQLMDGASSYVIVRALVEALAVSILATHDTQVSVADALETAVMLLRHEVSERERKLSSGPAH